MADEAALTIAVLAAGQSRRFGKADKLREDFRGSMLGMCAVNTLAHSTLFTTAQQRIVITANLQHACSFLWREAGFDPVLNPNADEGMGASVAQAARIARRADSAHLLIALADMPLVPADHFEALVAAAQEKGAKAIIASSDGNVSMPPVVFGSDHFDTLAELSGDQGARGLLAHADTLAAPAEWLCDIDTPEALAKLQDKP